MIIFVSLIMLTAGFSSSSLSLSDPKILSISNYTFSMTLTRQVSTSSSLSIFFPSDFSSSSLSSLNCVGMFNLKPKPTCVASSLEVKLTNLYNESLSSGQTIVFKLTFIKNISIGKTTSSFKITSKDSKGKVLESLVSGMTATFIPLTLDYLKIETRNQTSGSLSSFVFITNFSVSTGLKSTVKIRVPYWNANLLPKAEEVKEIFENNIECSLENNLNNVSQNCEYLSGSVFIYLDMAFFGNVKIFVDSGLSPASTETLFGFDFEVFTDEGNLMSFSNSSVSAVEPCMTNVEIISSNEELSTFSDYSFKLTTCLPFNSRSSFKISFPPEIKTTLSLVHCIFGFDRIHPTFSISGQEVLITNFFTSYKTFPRALEFKLLGMRNPSTTLLSSGIIVNMTQNNYISSTSQGIFLTFAAGTLKVNEIWAGNSTITAETFMIFNLSAGSSIPKGAVLYLKLPDQIKIDSVNIQVLQGMSDQVKTTVVNNTIIIQQAFTEDTSKPFAFNLSVIHLPSTTKATSAFIIKVFKENSLSTSLFQVTSYTFKATPGTLFGCQASPDEKMTGKVTSYAFGCAGGIGKNQEFFVEFPEDVSLILTSSVCFGYSGFSDESECEGSTSSVKVKTFEDISNDFLFKISNVKNCRSFKPVKFQFSVSTDEGYLVKQGEVWTELDIPSAFSQLKLLSSSLTVSKVSSYIFTLSPFNPVTSSSYLIITSELDLSSASCGSPYSCIFNEGLKVLLNSVQETYVIEVFNIKNPDSLKPFLFNISSFSPYKQDSSIIEHSMKTGGSIISISQSLSSSFINTESSLVLTLKYDHSLDQIDSVLIEFPSSFTSLKFQNTSQNWPIQLSPPSSEINSIQFTLPETAKNYSYSIKTFKNSYLVDEGSFTLSVICQTPCLNCSKSSSKCTKCINSLPFLADSTCYSQCPAGQSDIGDFTCSYCLKNCEKCLDFKSCDKCFDGFFLDSSICTDSCPSGKFASEGLCESCLSICKTCESTRDQCTSCDSGMFLYKTTCTAFCPGIVSNQLCQDCEDCLTCSETVKNCTSCLADRFLFQHNCYATCPDGTFQYSSSCLECSSECKTCSGWLNKCTSCYEGSNLSGSLCIPFCQQGFYYKEGSCLPCSSKCLTCKDEPDYCLLCLSGFSYKGECLAECPEMITIESSTTCIDCLDSCLTCQGLVSSCSSCEVPLLLHSSSCVASCPTGFFNISNTCIECSDNCQVCNLSSCQLCQPGLILHQGFCLESCPEGSYLNNEQCFNCSLGCVECIAEDSCFECLPSFYQLDGYCVESCPEDFTVEGRSCAEVICAKNCTALLLNNSVCDPECDFEECDYDDSACEVPKSQEMRIEEEPFSFTTATVAVSVAAGTVSIMTGGSLVMSIAPVTAVLESTGWFAVALSLNLRGKGRRLVESFSEASEACFIGIFIVLAIRIGFNCLVIRRYSKIRTDEKHEQWIQSQFKSWVGLNVVSLIFSFKILSVMTCGFLGLSLFSAEFEKPSEFYRFLFIFTVIDLIIFVIPMLCICIYILSIYSLDSFVFILTADVFIVTVLSIIISVLVILIYSRKLKATKSQSRMVSIAVPTAFEDIEFTSSEGIRSGSEDKLAIIKQFLDNLRNFEKLRKIKKIPKCRSLDLSEDSPKADALNFSMQEDRLNETLQGKEPSSILIHSFEENKNSEISLSSIEIQVDDKTNDLFEFPENNLKASEGNKSEKFDQNNFEVLEVDQEDFEIVRVKVKDLGKVICLKKSFADGVFVDENGIDLQPQPVINYSQLEFVQIRSENPGIGIFRLKTGELVRILRTFTHAQVVQDRKRSLNYEFSLNSRRELVEKAGVKAGHPLFWKFENPKVQQRSDFS